MTEPAHGLFGPGILGTGIDLSALDEDTALRLGQFMGQQLDAAEARGFARAVAAMRDDELYERWTRAQVEPRTFVNRVKRDVCGDYLEALAVSDG